MGQRNVLSAALLTGLLAGCGGGSDNTAPPAARAGQANESVVPAVPVAASLPMPLPAPVPVNAGPPPAPPSAGRPPRVPETHLRTAGDAAPPPSNEASPSLVRTVFLRGLQEPQDMALTPDGALFFTERTRGLSVRQRDGVVMRLFAPEDLATDGGGMFGVAVDPQFPVHRFVYVFLTSRRGDKRAHRVVRLELDGSYAVRERVDIVSGIAAGADAGAVRHAGGALRFGADGMLYIGSGDALDAEAPQSPVNLAGKLLRVDRDGLPAAANRTPRGFDPRIFAFGLRQPVALAMRTGDTAVLVAEEGAGHDELGWFGAGANGGWDPRCETAAVKSPAPASYCGAPASDKSRPLAAMTDLAKFPDAVRPVWTNLNRAQGMAGTAFLRGENWKSWSGAIAVAYTDAQRVDVLQLNAAGGVTGLVPLLPDAQTRIRALASGLDGALYVATDRKRGGDEIWRVEPR
jgi:glucose/arabinose dehydrogenase